ncbi:MAG TPA: hypothetical protein VFG55_04610 [Rhodanobacteraceae bacterium]|nr:hypothetical protein [Rhodanobacteraceae bacterium]
MNIRSFHDVRSCLRFVFMLATIAIAVAGLQAIAGTPPPTPILVADINTGVGPVFKSRPIHLTRLNDTQTVFAATDRIHGTELWITDGTEAGTHLLVDFCPGHCDGLPQPLNGDHATTLDELYVAADDGVHGLELWKLDSNAPIGARLVSDLRAGPLGSGPGPMAFPPDTPNIGFFAATTAAEGRELWSTDADDDTTVLVRDIVPGTESSAPTQLVGIENQVLFSASTPATGRELFGSDGREAGTQLRKDINPGPTGSSPSGLVPISPNIVMLSADDGSHGTELWFSSTSVTVLLKDIAPGLGSSAPADFTPFGTGFFFTADGTGQFIDRELWFSDGTRPGTSKFADLCPGNCSSEPYGLTVLDGDSGPRILFLASISDDSFDNWYASDGNADNIEPLLDQAVFSPTSPTRSGPFAYLVSRGLIVRTDGTATGTLTVANDQDFDSAVGTGALGADRLLISGVDVQTLDNEPYVAGPDPGDFGLLENIGADSGYSDIDEMTTSNGALYFTAFSEQTLRRLWKVTDPAGGAEPITAVPGLGNLADSSDLTAFGNQIVFADGGSQLFISDGTEAGTHPFADFEPADHLDYFDGLSAVGDRLFFNAILNSDPVGFNPRPFASNGTTAGTVDLSPDVSIESDGTSGHSFVAAGDRVVFSARSNLSDSGREPYHSDGSPEGTAQVRDIEPAPGISSEPDNFVSLGALACFRARTLDTGFEPWCTDATEQGTVPLGDLFPGEDSSDPRSLTAIDGWLVFSATAPQPLGRRPFRSDGTAAGTVPLPPGFVADQDLIGTTTGSTAVRNSADQFEHAGSLVYFPCLGGVMCTQDIRPGHENDFLSRGGVWDFGIDQLRVVPYGEALFGCYTPATGRELCHFDGRTADSAVLTDIAPGPESSSPEQITIVGDFIYFTADDGVHGRELWALPVAGTLYGIFRDDFD